MYAPENDVVPKETVPLKAKKAHAPKVAADPLEELIGKLNALHQASWTAKAVAFPPGYCGRFAVPWRILNYIWDYCVWFAKAWWRVALTFSTVLLQPLNILSLVFFASAASAALFALLLTDIFLAIPAVYEVYKVVNDYMIAGPLPSAASSDGESLSF